MATNRSRAAFIYFGGEGGGTSGAIKIATIDEEVARYNKTKAQLAFLKLWLNQLFRMGD